MNDFHNLIKIIVVLVIVLGWIISAFIKVFMKATPQQGGGFPRQGGVGFPRQPQPPIQPGEEAGRALGPGEMELPPQAFGPKRELAEFFTQLRRASEKAESSGRVWEDPEKRAQEAFAGGRRMEEQEADSWDQYEWGAVPPLQKPPTLAEIRFLKQASPHPQLQPETRPGAAAPRHDFFRDSLEKAIREAPHELGRPEEEPSTEMDLPHWLSIAELTQPGGTEEILGIPIAKAILLREVLGPPKALRMRQPAHFRRTI